MAVHALSRARRRARARYAQNIPAAAPQQDTPGSAEPINAPQNPYNTGAFHHACEMEDHLRVASDLMDSLMFMAEGIDEGGSAISTIASLAKTQNRAAEALRCEIFRATHPEPARLQERSSFRAAEAEYRQAEHRFNNLPPNLEDDDEAEFQREEAAYHAALDRVSTTPVATWQEFGAAYLIACNDGETLPATAVAMKLVVDAKRLLNVPEGR